MECRTTEYWKRGFNPSGYRVFQLHELQVVKSAVFNRHLALFVPHQISLALVFEVPPCALP